MAPESLQVRRRPTRGKPGDLQRDSSVIRASVLETALELGFAQNSAVANWIFNNPLPEEPEDLIPQPDTQELDAKPEPVPYVAEAITPTLTSGSNSISDESSLNSPANNARSAAITTIQVHSHKPSVTETPYVHFDDFSSDQLQLFSPFTLSPHDAHHAGTRGNSAGNHPRDTERSRSQDDTLRHNPSHESPSPGPTETGYTSEGQYLSKAKGSKGKGKPAKPKANKSSKSDVSKTVEKDGDYTSDGGYLSASSSKSLGKSPGRVKSRAMAFFRRRPKKSARGSDAEDEDTVPPVPAIPILPRPSSPKPLERRAAPSSPTRSGFSPLTLNLTTPPASPPRRRASKSPPPVHARVPTPQRSGQVSVPQRPASPLVASASAPAASATTVSLPPSVPSTPLSSASFPTTSPPLVQPAWASKSLTASSSRQHLGIPPPAPPPTLPLPQLPPSPSISPVGMLHSLPATPSRKGVPTRPIPVVPMTPGSTRPLTPRSAGSPLRPLLSPRVLPLAASHARMGETPNTPEDDPPNGKGTGGRQRSGTAGLGSTPAFLQRKIQAPSPRHPPPDGPLPPSPCPTPSTRPRTPIGSPSKFHEHFSSVSSVPLSQVLSVPDMSPSPSRATLSGSSSGPSIRSSHISSTSERSEEPAVRDRLNIQEYSRPTTSTSFMSESSYGQPISSTFGRSFGRSALHLRSHFSDRSDVNSSIYSATTHQDNGSVTTFDDDDVDVDDTAPKSCVDEDDGSMYPSDDKTAGRRTMYLMEHGVLGENGDEVVIAGSRYWGGREVPPPVPSLPPMPTRPGPGYF